MTKLLLKIPEVCAELSLGRNKVYELLDVPGGLQTIRIGRAVRVPADAVREWVQRRVVEAEEARNGG
jgi:excisionase family DNA binding protein